MYLSYFSRVLFGNSVHTIHSHRSEITSDSFKTMAWNVLVSIYLEDSSSFSLTQQPHKEGDTSPSALPSPSPQAVVASKPISNLTLGTLCMGGPLPAPCHPHPFPGLLGEAPRWSPCFRSTPMASRSPGSSRGDVLSITHQIRSLLCSRSPHNPHRKPHPRCRRLPCLSLCGRIYSPPFLCVPATASPFSFLEHTEILREPLPLDVPGRLSCP